MRPANESTCPNSTQCSRPYIIHVNRFTVSLVRGGAACARLRMCCGKAEGRRKSAPPRDPPGRRGRDKHVQVGHQQPIRWATWKLKPPRLRLHSCSIDVRDPSPLEIIGQHFLQLHTETRQAAARAPKTPLA